MTVHHDDLRGVRSSSADLVFSLGAADSSTALRGPLLPQVSSPQEPMHWTEHMEVTSQRQAKPLEPPQRVLVHVYDWGTSGFTRLLNSYAQGAGIFHTGVEVYGSEWSFGGRNEAVTGVTRSVPRTVKQHTYRTTVFMGFTMLSLMQVEKLLEVLQDKWSGDEYNMLFRNCNHFSDVLCALLGCDHLPAWIFGVLQHTQSVPQPPSINTLASSEDRRHPAVLAERSSTSSPTTHKGATGKNGSSGPLSPAARRSVRMGKENLKITPLALSATMPTSPDSVFIDKSLPHVSPYTLKAGDDDTGVAKLDFDAEALDEVRPMVFKMRETCAQWSEVPGSNVESTMDVDRQASISGSSAVWQEVPVDVEEDVADERSWCAEASADIVGGAWHEQVYGVQHEPTGDFAWREAIAADAAVRASPPGGLPQGWQFGPKSSPGCAQNPPLVSIDPNEDWLGVAHEERRLSFESLESEAQMEEDCNEHQCREFHCRDNVISNLGRRPRLPRAQDCKINKAMLHDLRSQAGDCVLLRWDSFTIDS